MTCLGISYGFIFSTPLKWPGTNAILNVASI